MFNGGLTATAPSGVTLNGQVRSSGDTIAIGDAGTPVTLAGGLSIIDTTNNGGTATGGAITVNGAVDGTAANTQSLTLVAGTTGTITFGSTIGATTPLSGLTVTSAAVLDFDNTVAVGNQGLNITAGTVGIDNTVTTTNGGAVNIANSGVLTIAAAADMTLDGAFDQDGTGTVSTAGDITTTGDNIEFDTAVTLTGDVAFSSGAAGGNITFQSTLDGTTALTEDLNLTAGTGNITFAGNVGGITPLGTVTVNSAGNVYIRAAFNVNSYVLRGSVLGYAPIAPVVYFWLPGRVEVAGAGLEALLEWLTEELEEEETEVQLEDAYLHSTDL